MYKAITHNIQVTALPEFLAERSEPDDERFFWAYTIEITNMSDRDVKLLKRHWVVTDANGQRHEIKGVGVVGEQPLLRPGESFRYTSGCPLSTPSGIMQGRYEMVAGDTKPFEVAIPAFSLDSPYVRKVLN